MDRELIFFLIVAGSHLVALVAAMAIVLSGDDVDWRSFWPSDDDDRGIEEATGPGPGPEPAGGRALAIPLEDSEPASVRLREPRGPMLPPPRRRVREPEPAERPTVPQSNR